MTSAARVRDALCHLLRIAPLIAIGLLLAAALVQQRTMIVQVTGERDRLVTVVTEATVAPDKDGHRPPLTPDQALTAARRMAHDLHGVRTARATSPRPSPPPIGVVPRSRAADVALATTQASNMREAARAAPRIVALAAAKPTGDPQADAALINNASAAPWGDWK